MKNSMYTSTVELITPETAESYLLTSEGNRAINTRTVNTYVKLLKNGSWVVNGASIKFDSTGHLFDGHHRLTAIIKSGIPAEIFVVRGIEDKRAFSTVDCGRGRTADQLLRIEAPDMKNTKTVVSAARAVMLLENNRLPGENKSAQLQKTNTEMLAYIKSLTNLESFVDRACNIVPRNGRSLLPQATIAAFSYHLVINLHWPESLVYRFFEQVTNRYTPAGNPTLETLRKRLLDCRDSRDKTPQQVISAYVVVAFNAFVAGKQLQRLHLSKKNDTVPMFSENNKIQ